MKQSMPISMMIISDSTALEERIRSVSISDGITPDIRTCNHSAVADADILIYDGAYMPKETTKIAGCFEYVLYASPEEVAALLQNNLPWTAIWQKPVPDQLMDFYVRQLWNAANAKKELMVTKSFLNTLINSVPDLIWFKDLRGSHLKVNDAFCRAVGKTKDQCEGRGHYYIWDLEPDEYAKGEYVCLETEEEVIRQNRTCLFDEKVKSKSGLRQFKTYKSPLTDTRGEMIGTVGIAKDVTDLQNIGRELDVILASIPFATMIADEDDAIIFVNQKFCEYFDVTAEHMLKMHYSEVCRDILGVTPQQLENAFMTELRYHRDGDQYVFQAQQQSIHDIFGNHFGTFFLCLDVTNEHELQHRLIHSANTDFLTNLYNRRHFYEVIGERMDKEQVSFVYFDLDDFKSVNDTYGHQSGDNALILMADLLHKAFPKEIITRLGGDEFVVAFFGVCVPSELTQKIKAFIERAGVVFHATAHMENLTVSAGIVCNGNGQAVDALLSCADKALYNAKALGKARYVLYGEAL